MLGLRYRLQVDLNQKRIAIFKPSEVNLPDKQKTYYFKVAFGTHDEADVMLTAEDLVVDADGRIIVNQDRFGHLVPGTRFGMTVEELRKFKQNWERGTWQKGASNDVGQTHGV